jgi:hypothetical protein
MRRLLRYQLLSASVGAVIEATRRGCDQAILIIEQFVGNPSVPTIEANELSVDLTRFLAQLGWNEPFGPGRIAGPFGIYDNGYTGSAVRLFVGWTLEAYSSAPTDRPVQLLVT